MTAVTPQKFRYLAVLDFEATCDDQAKLPQEIIEFPICVIDTSLAKFLIIKEFHAYVKPVHNPVLTPFCKELTGIQQETVDSAPPFGMVWAQVLEFLRTNSLDETNTLFVTCGHWDLFKMLPSQLKTSKLGGAPPVLSQWCNIKVALKDYSGRDIRGMFDMLKYFNLPLIGRHHSGIDDARNIAAVARSMLKSGYVFDVTP
ncbi:ERI1 exoribonuclease 3, partial [Rhizoclosmatium hyalinum]